MHCRYEAGVACGTSLKINPNKYVGTFGYLIFVLYN